MFASLDLTEEALDELRHVHRFIAKLIRTSTIYGNKFDTERPQIKDGRSAERASTDEMACRYLIDIILEGYRPVIQAEFERQVLKRLHGLMVNGVDGRGWIGESRESVDSRLTELAVRDPDTATAEFEEHANALRDLVMLVEVADALAEHRAAPGP